MRYFVNPRLRINSATGFFVMSGLILLSIVTNASAQDCTSGFEVEAGPDIDVCETGSVILSGVIGGKATTAVWRGGKGTFSPGRQSLNIEYTPDSSEAGTTVVLILVASNPDMKECPPNRDQLKLTINPQPSVNAGEDQRICEGENVSLNAIIKDKAKNVTWKSNGTGTFDNQNKTNAIYSPSASDTKRGVCYLGIIAQPQGVCLVDSDEMMVIIDPLPLIETAGEVKSNGKEAVHLLAKISESGNQAATTNTGKIKWSTSGSGKFSSATKKETDYIPSVEDIKQGTIKLNISVTSFNGKCIATKDILLHTDTTN